MGNVVPFPGGKRCLVCKDQIDPARVRANPDIVTCTAGCQVERDAAGTKPSAEGKPSGKGPEGKRDTLTISQ